MPNLTGKAANQVVTHGDLGPLAYYSAEMLSAAVVEQILVVRDEKAQGAAADTISSSSAWLTRTLNTTASNTMAGASLASSLITLKAGTYQVQGSDSAYRGNAHKARLYNVTASAVLLVGSAEYADTTSFDNSRSVISGQFTLAADSQLRLEHYASNSSSANWGTAVSGTSGVEVYAELTFRRISA